MANKESPVPKTPEEFRSNALTRRIYLLLHRDISGTKLGEAHGNMGSIENILADGVTKSEESPRMTWVNAVLSIFRRLGINAARPPKEE